MAKGQMRSNREKKKPKQDKNKKKGAEASSPLAGMHSQVKLGTSYRHLVHEPIRQEALADDHRARPQRASYDFGEDSGNMSGVLRDQVRR